jgi:hypothetical protein
MRKWLLDNTGVNSWALIGIIIFMLIVTYMDHHGLLQ